MAVQACNDFLRLGCGRSLPGLLRVYVTQTDENRRRRLNGENPLKPTSTHQNQEDEDEEETPLDPPAPAPTSTSVMGRVMIHITAPTLSLDTLKGWSSQYNWTERAALYDLAWEEEKEAARRAVMDEGFGLDYERTRGLKRLARLLEGMIFESSAPPSGLEVQDSEALKYHNIWVHDVKSIGAGEDAERVDLVKFNSALIKEWRGVLDEIASETGGRRPSAHLESFVKRVQKEIDYNKLSPAQLDRITRGEHPLVVLLDQYLVKDE